MPPSSHDFHRLSRIVQKGMQEVAQRRVWRAAVFVPEEDARSLILYLERHGVSIAPPEETPEEYMEREGWQYMGSASDDA